jgi:hypothetical protein
MKIIRSKQRHTTQAIAWLIVILLIFVLGLRARRAEREGAIESTQPVFAYLNAPTLATNNFVRVDVGNTTNLPIEVLGFDVNGSTFLPARRYWLSMESVDLLIDVNEADKTAKVSDIVLQALEPTQNPVVSYARFNIPLAEIHRQNSEHDFMQEMNIQVLTRILGIDEVETTPARHGYPTAHTVPTPSDQ